MAASIVQICNLALLKFGNITITSIDNPQSKEERACAVFYPLMRNLLLYSHPWNFAMKSEDISAQLATAPPFKWDYAYQLPADCLRAWELYGTDDEWDIEDGQLVTNKEEEIYLRYISLVTESGKFSPAFDNCLATRLAAELCSKLSDNASQRQALMAEFEVLLQEAYHLNAIEGKKPRPKDSQSLDNGNFSWQTEGR